MDIQKTMEFILEQQAANAVEHAAFQREMKEQKAAQDRLGMTMQQLIDFQLQQQDWIQNFATNIEKLRVSVAELRTSQTQTDERLNILVNVVQGLTGRPPRR